MEVHMPWLNATHAQSPGWAMRGLPVRRVPREAVWDELTGVGLGSAQTRDLRKARQVTSLPQVALPCSICCNQTAW